MGILDALTGMTPEQNSGLLGFGAQLLSSSSNPYRPTDFGSAIQAGQQSAQEAQRRKQQEAEAQQMAAMRTLQLRSGNADFEAQQRATEKQALIQSAAQGSIIEGKFDPGTFINKVQQIDPLEASKFAQQFAKVAPKFSDKVQTAQDENGQPYQYILNEAGEEKRLSGKPRDEAKWLNLDNRMVAASPFAPAGTSFNVGVSPSAQLSANVSMRGQNMSDARAREANQISKAPPGYRFMPDGSLQVIAGGPADVRSSKEGVQKVQDARDVLSILDEAEPLLSKSTSSYLGAGRDQVARVFGSSTDGGEAAAQLKVLQGQLVAKQPKMSGPQSDKDVQLYREMAGQIGDPTLPESSRRAAAQTIRKLSEKYLNDQAGAPAKSKAAGWSIKKVGQ